MTQPLKCQTYLVYKTHGLLEIHRHKEQFQLRQYKPDCTSSSKVSYLALTLQYTHHTHICTVCSLTREYARGAEGTLLHWFSKMGTATRTLRAYQCIYLTYTSTANQLADSYTEKQLAAQLVYRHSASKGTNGSMNRIKFHRLHLGLLLQCGTKGAQKCCLHCSCQVLNRVERWTTSKASTICTSGQDCSCLLPPQ